MGDDSNVRRWDELIPDALVLIFKNLSLQDMLTVIPSVCKSWERAVLGPYCWQEIDILEWSRHFRPQLVDRLLRLLIPRSHGSLHKLCVSGVCRKETFEYIANNARSLQILQLPRSELIDPVVKLHAGKFSNLTFLDISFCYYMSVKTLEAIGMQCKNLTFLRRVMEPLVSMYVSSQDDETYAIAATMPKLKFLQICYMLVSTESVNEIIKSCSQLEVLDIQGCWAVIVDENFNNFFGLKVVGPDFSDCCVGFNNFSSGSSGYLPPCDFDAAGLAYLYHDVLDWLCNDDYVIF